MAPLGRGLESLIPQDNSENKQKSRFHADDILAFQENLEEPVHSISLAGDVSLLKYKGIRIQTATSEPSQIKTPPAAVVAKKTYEYAVPSQPESKNSKQADSIFWIEASKIEPNPFQPRRVFEEEGLKTLADSIKNYGILQPLLVTKIEEETSRGLAVRYQLIAGERRWRASQLAGLREVPIIIKKDKLHDRLKLELALIENVQREDLNPIERAVAFKQLADDFRLTQKEIAEKVGKSREYVTNSMRLLTLPDNIQEQVRASQLSEGHARALLMLSGDASKQRILLEEIARTKLNVREAEFAARALLGHRRVPQRKDVTRLEFGDREWQRQLEEFLGTRVSLVKMDGGKGKIVVEFYSDEELRSILEKMIREA
ncbi:MAG: ParB-like protein partition protein [Parcubacteria group bacterium GW2011_GWA2_47_10]|nr:MAG: ParB-like protein partition protein [Parcubacteria group bacterium GW2011_GWA2_47_10]